MSRLPLLAGIAAAASPDILDAPSSGKRPCAAPSPDGVSTPHARITLPLPWSAA
jgi:hypothetical protein